MSGLQVPPLYFTKIRIAIEAGITIEAGIDIEAENYGKENENKKKTKIKRKFCQFSTACYFTFLASSTASFASSEASVPRSLIIGSFPTPPLS